MRLRLLLTIIILLAALLPGHGNERYYRNIGEMGDFGSLTINAIHKDSTGFVWMAADPGILRTDGVHTRLIPLPGAAHPLHVTSFASLPGHRLAVGTRTGLHFINQLGHLEPQPPGSSTIEVTSLLHLAADTLLVGTTQGLKLFDSTGRELRQPRYIPHPSQPFNPETHIISLALDPAGRYIATTPSHTFRQAPGGRDFELFATDNLPLDAPVSLTILGNQLWMARMASGLWVLDLSTGTTHEVHIDNPVVTSVTAANGTVYVGTDGGGVILLDPATETIRERIVHQPNRLGALASNQVYSIMVDSHGLLWVGYYQHGADYSLNSSGLFETYNDPRWFNSHGMGVRTITITPRYTAVGTRQGLIIHHPQSRPDTLRRPRLASDIVIAVREIGNQLYIGTYGGGMSVYDPTRRQLSPFAPERPMPFTRGHIFAITPDNDNGDIWIGTSDGLFRYTPDGRLRQHFTSTNSILPPGNVYEITFDSRRRGWVCTENGIVIYDPITGTLRADILPPSFPRQEKIRIVYEDSHHRLYLAPEKGRVKITDPDFSRLDSLDYPALSEADIKALTEDPRGNIWITTNRGIMRWNRRDEMLKFGLADGLPSMQFIQCTPAHDDQGNLWFGNSSGLIKLDTRNDPTNSSTTHPLLPTDITAGGNDNTHCVDNIHVIDTTHFAITLDRHCTAVNISFSPFTYTTPDAVTYEYSIDNGPWTPIPYTLTATIYNTFTTHRFTIRVRPEGNTHNITTIDITMPRSIAMKLIMALGIVALLLVVYIIYVWLRVLSHRYRDKNRETLDDTSAADATTSDRPGKYRSNPLNTADSHRIIATLDTIMERQRLYTDPNLTIGQLATLAGISSHKLSQVFSQHLNMKFYDYVNRFRVNEFKRIASNGGASRYTLTAMAEKAGFSSRATFFRHFKEIEGISPGEYLRRLTDNP